MTTEHSGSGDIHRSLALMWDLDQKPTRGPKPALTLDRIVAAAIQIADADGLEALSMRRVAEALGVGTMSLYRYVPGKAELLDLMLDQISTPDPSVDSLGDDWRTAMETLGRGMWTLYLRHPWLPFVDQSRPLLGPNSLDGFEFALHGMDDSGLTSQQKVNAIGVIEAFVSSAARLHNNAVTAEQRSGLSTEEFWLAQTPVIEKAMSTGRYPLIATLDEDAFASTGEEFLEFGLQCVLYGLQALVDTRHERAAPDR
ncbi:MAG: TetR/AcrR family transcriptional regulator [Jiangellaceae bacterium]